MKKNPYAAAENKRQIHWLQNTEVLPIEAQAGGVYTGRDGIVHDPIPLFLPCQLAAHNLLPTVRDGALALFESEGIHWHNSIDGGPSNHLRDSQVQCVNALFPMVADPERLKRAFGHAVDIAEVLPIEPRRFMTFEYIGPSDYFDERKGKPRVRGTKCTSVDAAFRYRTSAGQIELALVEWKYTESYLHDQPRTGCDETRRKRYEADFLDPTGPVRSDILDFEAMLNEPFYQLMRQQLLARRLEEAHAEDAQTVRVLHVLSPDNAGYEVSLKTPVHQAAGASVSEIWNRMLRTRDRFLPIDPAVFLDPEVTSTEYVERYGMWA